MRSRLNYDLKLRNVKPRAVPSAVAIQEQEDMPEYLAVSSPNAQKDAERAELDAVAKALARYSRLSHLAFYLGEMYLSGKSDEINEYNIATEVMGRSKTSFDAVQDAVVRVEMHRLRKRLQEFYETHGKNHTVQLSIPVGSYIPVFVHKTEDIPDGALRGAPKLAASPLRPGRALGSAGALASGDTLPGNVEKTRWRGWIYALGSVALVVALYGGYRTLHPASETSMTSAGMSPAQPISSLQPALPGTAPFTIRLIAGYSGSSQIDSAGTAWSLDQFFHGGKSWVRPISPIFRTSDPQLFRQWRTGDFTYDIPLPPGVYELHLYFVASEREGDEFATFSVFINGDRVLSSFDVKTDALGENVADERVFRDVTPAKDGILHINFVSERGVPVLNALEVLPGIPHKQLPIRLLTQSTSFTDHNGNLWRPDTYFLNGKMSVQRRMAEGSADPGLYAAERYGYFNYAIPVDTRDRYTLVLHFAEFYFGPTASGTGGTGDRVFRVLCNGATLLDDFDIYKEAGSLHALTKTFYHLKPTAQGKLNITFEPIVNFATVSGIEVLDESQ